MKVFRSTFLIINYKTFIVTFLAVISTWLCGKYNIKADFPLTLIGIAIVFPVVFSIDSAYKRRERSLMLLADFKAHALALYHASRDWIKPENKEYQEKVKFAVLDLYESIRILFCAKAKDIDTAEKRIYLKMSGISKMNQEFRDLGLQVGEVSRVSQYLSKISLAVENLKTILHYRTPITLRAYSKIFIYSFPVIYGPYFVFAAEEYSQGLEYMMPVIFSFILVSLDNIQAHLENPFDQIGEDDIKFDVEEFAILLDDNYGLSTLEVNETGALRELPTEQ